MRRLLLLRPEPGLSASAERASALGLEVIARPLFRIEPVEWAIPGPADYDALILTSANAVRTAGPGLETLKSLPVHAVGAETAAVARDAGLTVGEVGQAGITHLLGRLSGAQRLLHLAGEDRRDADSPHELTAVTVYRSATIEEAGLPPLDDLVIAVHSPRAAARLVELAGPNPTAAIAAISKPTAHACGFGWQRVAVAGQSDDGSLLALAARLCQDLPLT